MQSPPSASRVIPANEYRRERWGNGLGWTREIARSPEQGDWNWRLSIAEIDQAAAFSRFPGVERVLVLLEGGGLALRCADRAPVVLEPPHGSHRFDGDEAVVGTPLDGRAVVFNLMWRRAATGAELWHRPLVGAMVVFIEPGETWAVHLMSGQAGFDDGSGLPPLAAGDTALLASPGARRARHVLDGNGEVLLVRLRAE